MVGAPPCHGGGREFESLLGRLLVTFSEQAINNYIWDHSSAGRASALQAEGHRFEPYRSHEARVAELADAQDLKSCCSDTVPVRFRSRARFKVASNPCKSRVWSFFIMSCIIWSHICVANV